MPSITYAIESLAFANCLWHKPEWRLISRKTSLDECRQGIERILAPFEGRAPGNPEHLRAVKLNAKGKVLEIFPATALLAGTAVESHVYKTRDLVAA
jgi:hypothetical protein